MRKILLLFTAALILASCDNLKKKNTKEKDGEEIEITKKDKNKSGDEDETKDKKKDNGIDDENYSPKKKDKNSEDEVNNNTQTRDNKDTRDTRDLRNTTSGMKTWDWNTYKMQFKAPTDFTVDENSSSKFDAGDGRLHLTIYPKKGDKLQESDLKSLLRSWARDTKLTYSGGVQSMTNLNGYWGVYLDATASNNLPTTVLLLVDPDDPTISFYVWLQYQAQYEDLAVDILKSFKPI